MAQPDHPVETTQENSHGESDNESVPSESPEKPQEDVSEAESVGGEKDDSNDESMSVEGEKDMSDKEDKEESTGVKKYQSIDIVNVDYLDYDDEPIEKKLALGIAKRLKNIKGEVVVSVSKSSKASKKSFGVGPAKEWRNVVTSFTNNRSLKRKEIY